MASHADRFQLVEGKVAGLRDALAHARGMVEITQKNLDKAVAEELRAREEKVFLQQVGALLERGGELGRESARKGFEQVVTHALRAIHGSSYSFHVEYEKLRGNVATQFRVSSAEFEGTDDPADERGGGVSNTVGMALRVSLLELLRPRLAGPLIMDEPWSELNGDELIERAGALLEVFSRRTGRQIIMSTGKRGLITSDMNVVDLGQ